MVEHTKGPWLVNPAIAQIDIPNADAPICQLLWPTDLRSEDETFANARLIAAAPDFAEVAPDAADLLEQYAEIIRNVPADEIERHPYLPSVEDTVRGLRAAIARALPPLTDKGE